MDTVKLKKIQETEPSTESPSSEHEIILQPTIKYSYQKGKTKKPKRNKSAFILFSVEMRAKLKNETQDQLNSNEMMVKLATLWKELPKAEREKYHSEAKSDKMRYLQELDNFSKAYPSESIHNKTKKNHVKKPCSSYAIFLKEMKGIIKEKSPDLKMADVLKIVSEKWKNLKEDEKTVYQERAKMEKELARLKLGESLQKGNTPNNICNEMPPVKKHKNERSGPAKVKIDPSQHHHLHVADSTILPKTSLQNHPEPSNINENSLLDRFGSRNFDFLPMVRGQSSQLSHFGLPQRSSLDEESRLKNLFDQSMKKSSELVVDLLNFSLPTERLDMLSIFNNLSNQHKNNDNMPTPALPKKDSDLVIPRPVYTGTQDMAPKPRSSMPPLHEILNNTIIDVLIGTSQNEGGDHPPGLSLQHLSFLSKMSKT